MMVFFLPISSPGKDEGLGGRGEFSPPPHHTKKSWIEAIQNRIKSANFLLLDNHPLSMLVLFIDWAPTL